MTCVAIFAHITIVDFRDGGSGGKGESVHLPPVVADLFTLSQPGGSHYAHQLLVTLPDFQTFRHPWTWVVWCWSLLIKARTAGKKFWQIILYVASFDVFSSSSWSTIPFCHLFELKVSLIWNISKYIFILYKSRQKLFDMWFPT